MSERCSKRVYSGSSFSGHQCTKPAKSQEKGKWWCAVHLPSAVAARNEKRSAEYMRQVQERIACVNAEQKRISQMEHKAACFDHLLEACETLLFELVAGPAARDEAIANARSVIAKAKGTK